MTLFCAGDIKWNVQEKDKIGRLSRKFHNLHSLFPHLSHSLAQRMGPNLPQICLSSLPLLE